MADPSRSGDARAEILGRIRTALADGPSPGPVPRDYDLSRVVADPVALLDERVSDYQATVRRVRADALTEAIGSALDARGARVMVGPADLPAEWQVPGVQWLLDPFPIRSLGADGSDSGSNSSSLHPERSNSVLDVATLDRCDGVLTGCAVAIAETGTIVLDSGPLQGRRALSLVPDYHLCVVRADQVVVSVPEAIARLEPGRPITFISGPSATSDIELDRVEGVHGPRTLEVLLVDG